MTMDRIDRILPPLFDELADPRIPDYLEAAIERASSSPQRPAWTFPGRWLPMQISTSAAPVARMPWRQIGVLALIGILIAIAAIAVGGASKPELLPAPPFGLAQNGVIAVELDGDIATVDPETGQTTNLTDGPDADSIPVFSPDGTQLAFQRTLGDGRHAVIMVAAADGSGVHQATPEPLEMLQPWSFSPDGTELLMAAAIDDRMRLMIQPVDGSAPTVLDIELPAETARVEPATFRPGDGDEILFLTTDESAMRGLYLFDRASGDVRTIVAPEPGTDTFGAVWSPTGDAIAFGAYDPAAQETTARAWIATVDGSQVRPADADPGTAYDIRGSEWSNDGSRFVVSRVYDDARVQPVIVSTTGDVAPLELACGDAVPCAEWWVWSPDDTELIGAVGGPARQYVKADPVTGAVTVAEWIGIGDPAWQRTGGEAPAD
jgi:dipeptidyl aminopeptidase/acylaminoacyl peptidase